MIRLENHLTYKTHFLDERLQHIYSTPKRNEISTEQQHFFFEGNKTYVVL